MTITARRKLWVSTSLESTSFNARTGHCELIESDGDPSEALEYWNAAHVYEQHDKPYWANVSIWSIDDDLKPSQELAAIRLPVNPREPACQNGLEHDWCTPHDVVGGLESNPGIVRKGGGYVLTDVCRLCAQYRIEDMWAEHPGTGTRGYHTVDYRDADTTSRGWVDTRRGQLTDGAEARRRPDWKDHAPTDTRTLLIITDDDDEFIESDRPAAEALKQWAASTKFEPQETTYWVSLRISSVDEDEDPDEEEYESLSYAVNPVEPPCEEFDDHKWCSPHEVLGGMPQNPGLAGKGGSTVRTEVCSNCGRYRIDDDWAQNPDTGEQGLDSINYSDADETSLEWIENRRQEESAAD